ncbi:TPA: chemotaxis protein CheW [Aeromonas salmonicida]|nr:chemotaxis protein CheW [Aeromonas salmonicida]AYO64281.1 chemotaxis protein CheW [Aeromonas salmonicida subsp. salmonicida 01-B526]EHI53580.1 chemotaxis protein CheW [Aeromonas salmonicida subsp. salmonicida 01-B526]EKP0237706.1 chemotaxis protein CheW [Aeromonas salmonicida]EKP0241886.1 chemotaxis protein CheW [Aeromonas salmonicida]EKP0250373.1 chemotaxis protein CheW [Aeromonas salmonicida]
MSMSTEVAAPPSTLAHDNQGDAQYLTFLINGEMFAINILGVKEIIEYGNITPIPMMPSFIRGVINLRGAVVSVVDLNARFGNAPSSITRRSCIVIIEGIHPDDSEHGNQDIGVVVDSVSEVLTIPCDEIEPPPSFGAHIRADFITGMGKVNGKFVILINTEKVLSIDEMAQLSELTQQQERQLEHRVQTP